eukprot:1290269-Alexandrium_andersonii.AAC.1
MKCHMLHAKGGEHGATDMIYSCVLSNRCPWCRNCLAEKATSYRHAERACKRGVCPADRTLFKRELDAPE